MNKVICLMGPTACGKTHIAMELVERFPLEIISVDSAMIYRGMDIGTAKPSKAELARAPHRLIDFLDPTETYSAADFVTDAKKHCHEIFSEGRTPLLVGGTMMYFHALQQGISDMPSSTPEIRQKILERADQFGWAALHETLAECDPESAARIHPNDPQRIQRALEVYEVSGRPLSDWWKNQSVVSEFEFVNIGLLPENREWLHERIAQRWKLMLEQGVIDEVDTLIERGDCHADLPSIRTVGYRQIWNYRHQQYDFDTMLERGLIATRQLAKRQMTWLRRWPNIQLLDPLYPQIFDRITAIVSQALGR